MKITLTIAGKKVELTVSEAKQLYKQLSELFNGEIYEEPWVNPKYVPSTPINPTPCPIQPLTPYCPEYPLTPYPPSYPYINCENSNDNTSCRGKNPFQRNV